MRTPGFEELIDLVEGLPASPHEGLEWHLVHGGVLGQIRVGRSANRWRSPPSREFVAIARYSRLISQGDKDSKAATRDGTRFLIGLRHRATDLEVVVLDSLFLAGLDRWLLLRCV